MHDLFDQNWEDLDPDGLRRFLEQAGEEGLTWEAKADDEKGPLHKGSLLKAACGLANQIGGYLIIGARWDKQHKQWTLPGITMPEEEAGLWLDKVLKGLQPTPRFVPKTWKLADGRLAAVVWVDPVIEPPCMTSRGQVYERVSGETLPVRDPAHLERLYQSGRHARERAEHAADRAAERAFDLVDWSDDRAVGLSLALAPVGRKADDAVSRLFVPSLHARMNETLTRFVKAAHSERSRFERTSDDLRIQQDAFAVLQHFGVSSPSQAAERAPEIDRSTWLLLVTLEGVVTASAAFTAEAIEKTAIDVFLTEAWQAAFSLLKTIGGYGEARLSFVVSSSQQGLRGSNTTLFSQLEPMTWIRRWTGSEGATNWLVVESMHRELERAAGRFSFEPEG